ncbi:hypothetical protein Tco_0728863 [Tanacetum coccineum]|uniref:Uncharacterized protein n=1 Tax=Tanacetum coccineum TaxID=301880 RepID=A0ABQ4YPZ5_9ASTR
MYPLEDKNELELTYPYEEVDPLNPPPPAFESEPEDVIEVENLIEHEDEIVPASVQEDINSLFGRMASLSRRLCGREMAHALVEKKGKAKDEYYAVNAEDKMSERIEEELKKQDKKSPSSVIEDLCFKKDQMKLSMFRFKMRRVHHLSREDLLMMLSSLDSLVIWFFYVTYVESCLHSFAKPLTQECLLSLRMIKESVDAAISTERARHANAGNDVRGSGPVRGQDAAPAVWQRKVQFVAAPVARYLFDLWNAKVAIMGLETVNQMPWTKMK